MPSGGHGRSGPPRDPNALRRDRDNDTWTTLPPERKGRAPAWPLPDQLKREAELWRKLWKLPQAVMWERDHQEMEVALYVRHFVDAEGLDGSVAARTLVVRMMEMLGLSQPGLARNRWRIEAPATAPRQTRTTGDGTATTSVRDRLRVVGLD